MTNESNGLNDDKYDECGDAALALYRHMVECLGTSVQDAAHRLIGCDLYVLGTDLPLDQALESLQIVRERTDGREVELIGRSN